MQQLLQTGIEVVDDSTAPSALFRGRRMVISGDLSRVDEGSLTVELEKLGARIEQKVSRMTDLMICGHGASDEIAAAKYYGTPLISENELLPFILEHSGRS